MAMDGILFCAYRLIFMVTSLTICYRFSFNFLMSTNKGQSSTKCAKFSPWFCITTDVTGLKIDYFQIKNSPTFANRKYIEKNPVILHIQTMTSFYNSKFKPLRTCSKRRSKDPMSLYKIYVAP